MNKNSVITIGRQFGSGGRQIGEKLADLLQLSFYDKELIGIASKESGLGKEFFEKADEAVSHSVFGGIFGVHAVYSNELYAKNYLNNETLFTIQSDVIRQLAEEKSCLFVGRCADYILQDHPHCLNIFITADMEDRLSRVISEEGIEETKAHDLIEKTDKKRAAYYNYFSNKTWGVADSYDLCINASILGISRTAEYISELVHLKNG